MSLWYDFPPSPGLSRVLEKLAVDYDDRTLIDYALKERINKSMKKWNSNSGK
jgi:hypothetical protein